MKKPFHLKWEAKKHRLKRNAGEGLREFGRVMVLALSIATVTILLLIAYDTAVRSSHFRIREITVKGCKELTEKEILALAGIRTRANLLTVNRGVIARRIQANPWIRNAAVGWEFPDRLVIVLKERTAVALLQGETVLRLLDSDGSAFKELDLGEGSNLPVLTGCVRQGKVDETLVKQSLALLSELAQAEDIAAIGAVSEVHGNETFGLSVFTDTGLCLQLGFDGYEGKLRKLAPVMADLDRKNLNAGFLLIDLSDPAKINVQQRSVLAPRGASAPTDAHKGYRL
ncbi:MAG: FtsQ-type POTRA domain-containing protein [Syntrophaceae bacterium]|nr:FtsQ-type POTRA domain-containing protein [Syntrophaceae bacterium]